MAKTEPEQRRLEEHELDAPDLLAAIREWQDDKEARTKSARIVKHKKELFERHCGSLKPGTIVRLAEDVVFEIAETVKDEYTVEASATKRPKMLVGEDS